MHCKQEVKDKNKLIGAAQLERCKCLGYLAKTHQAITQFDVILIDWIYD